MTNSGDVADLEVLLCLRSAVNTAKEKQIQSSNGLREALKLNGFSEPVINKALNLWGDYVRKDFQNFK